MEIWTGQADRANELFGDKYGIDWEYVSDSLDIMVGGKLIKIGDEIIEDPRAIPPQYQPGDLVRLKSGGPIMTVNKIDEERKLAECFYFAPNVDGYYKDCIAAAFPFIVLVK